MLWNCGWSNNLQFFFRVRGCIRFEEAHVEPTNHGLIRIISLFFLFLTVLKESDVHSSCSYSWNCFLSHLPRASLILCSFRVFILVLNFHTFFHFSIFNIVPFLIYISIKFLKQVFFCYIFHCLSCPWFSHIVIAVIFFNVFIGYDFLITFVFFF